MLRTQQGTHKRGRTLVFFTHFQCFSSTNMTQGKRSRISPSTTEENPRRFATTLRKKCKTRQWQERDDGDEVKTGYDTQELQNRFFFHINVLCHSIKTRPRFGSAGATLTLQSADDHLRSDPKVLRLPPHFPATRQQITCATERLPTGVQCPSGGWSDGDHVKIHTLTTHF